MSRSVTSLALAAITLASLAGSASAQKTKRDESPRPMVGMARADKAAEQDAKRADQRANRDMKRAFGMAVSEQAHLAKGLKLTPDARRQWKSIDMKYDAQYRDLRKEIRAAEQGGRPVDPAWTRRIQSLRDQERAELRGLLTPAQQVVFDRNVSRRR